MALLTHAASPSRPPVPVLVVELASLTVMMPPVPVVEPPAPVPEPDPAPEPDPVPVGIPAVVVPPAKVDEVPPALQPATTGAAADKSAIADAQSLIMFSSRVLTLFVVVRPLVGPARKMGECYIKKILPWSSVRPSREAKTFNSVATSQCDARR
jgi:hypothetical protein